MAMTQQMPSMSRPARWVRGIRLDHNPLRRGTDRAETAITALFLAAFGILAPLAAVTAGGWAAAAAPGARQEHAYQVRAVLLGSAPPAGSGVYMVPV
jgi:hypothetical protein